MFGIDGPELLVIIIVLIVVVGPKDLPKMMRAFGKAMARMRATAQEFRDHFDEAMREADMEDMADTFRDVGKLDPRKKITEIFDPFRSATCDTEEQVQDAAAPRVSQNPETVPEGGKPGIHSQDTGTVPVEEDRPDGVIKTADRKNTVKTAEESSES